MSEQRDDDLFVDGAVFNENANRMPPDEQLRYAGLHVAWNREGTRILASGRTEEELEEGVKAAGLRLSQVVMDYFLPDDVDGLILRACGSLIALLG